MIVDLEKNKIKKVKWWLFFQVGFTRPTTKLGAMDGGDYFPLFLSSGALQSWNDPRLLNYPPPFLSILVL